MLAIKCSILQRIGLLLAAVLGWCFFVGAQNVQAQQASCVGITDPTISTICSQWLNYPSDAGQWHFLTNTFPSGTYPAVGSTYNADPWTGYLNNSQQALQTTDAVFEFKMYQNGDDDDFIGWTFRHTYQGDPTNITNHSYYAFITDDGRDANSNGGTRRDTGLYKRVGNNYVKLVDSNWQRTRRTEYKVKIDMTGNTIKVWIDGVLLINYTDNNNPLTRGGYGPGTQSQAYAYFYEITVNGTSFTTQPLVLSSTQYNNNTQTNNVWTKNAQDYNTYTYTLFHGLTNNKAQMTPVVTQAGMTYIDASRYTDNAPPTKPNVNSCSLSNRAQGVFSCNFSSTEQGTTNYYFVRGVTADGNTVTESNITQPVRWGFQGYAARIDNQPTANNLGTLPLSMNQTVTATFGSGGNWGQKIYAHVLARDIAGNIATTDWLAASDTEQPQIIFNADTVSWQRKPEVSFKVTDADFGLHTVRYKWSNENSGVNGGDCSGGTALTVPAGTTEFLSGLIPLPTQLTAEALTLQVCAVDMAGNKTGGSVTVKIDLTPPRIIVNGLTMEHAAQLPTNPTFYYQPPQLQVTDTQAGVQEIRYAWISNLDLKTFSLEELRVMSGINEVCSSGGQSLSPMTYGGENQALTLYPRGGAYLYVCARDQTIAADNVAAFAQQFNTWSYAIEVIAKDGGQVHPGGLIGANAGDNLTIKMQPDLGYEFRDALVDGKGIDFAQITALNKDRFYTFNNIQSDHTLVAEFVRDGIYDQPPNNNVDRNCVDTVPSGNITIDRIERSSPTGIILHFSYDGNDQVDSFTVFYGFEGQELAHALIGFGDGQTRQVAINDLDAKHTYYFVMGANNGCALGKNSAGVKIDLTKPGNSGAAVSVVALLATAVRSGETNSGANNSSANRGNNQIANSGGSASSAMGTGSSAATPVSGVEDYIAIFGLGGSLLLLAGIGSRLYWQTRELDRQEQ